MSDKIDDVQGAPIRTASALALLTVSLILQINFSIDGIRSSKLVGAGAAQADLAFFMMLAAISPVIVATLIMCWFLMFRVRRHNKRLCSALMALNVAVLVWNWFFLLNVWKK